MTPGVVIFYAIAAVALIGLALMWWAGRQAQRFRNTRHVISLPIGARFTLDDSDSTWVLIHLHECGQAVEWKGNFHPTSKQRHRQIVGNERNLRDLVVKVVQ